MKKMVDGAFRRFAEAATVLHKGEEKSTLGFLQPITKESGEEPFHVGVLGAKEERCWRFLGAGDCPIVQGDGLIFAGERYRAIRAEAILIGGEVSHYEAVLCKEERV